MIPLGERAHWLYRCYDAEGFLLYIGVTSNIEARMATHKGTPRTGWSYPNGQLHERMATYEAEEFPDRQSAFEAEAMAIRAERPPLNIAHATGRPLTPYVPMHRRVRPTEEFPMLEKDYTLKEAGALLNVSTRWIRDRIKTGIAGDGPFVAHVRRGNKIMFTTAQLEELRSLGTQAPPPAESVTTGPRRKRSA